MLRERNGAAERPESGEAEGDHSPDGLPATNSEDEENAVAEDRVGAEEAKGEEEEEEEEENGAEERRVLGG